MLKILIATREEYVLAWFLAHIVRAYIYSYVVVEDDETFRS